MASGGGKVACAAWIRRREDKGTRVFVVHGRPSPPLLEALGFDSGTCSLSQEPLVHPSSSSSAGDARSTGHTEAPPRKHSRHRSLPLLSGSLLLGPARRARSELRRLRAQHRRRRRPPLRPVLPRLPGSCAPPVSLYLP
ncbi:hypothetical protein ZWY2020_050640 [Hordeum vulgare]|nr:hypothetical protein ZWY2020_050640 [Hordeum vulgare]